MQLDNVLGLLAQRHAQLPYTANECTHDRSTPPTTLVVLARHKQMCISDFSTCMHVEQVLGFVFICCSLFEVLFLSFEVLFLSFEVLLLKSA